MPMPIPMLAACSTAQQGWVCASRLRAHWPGQLEAGVTMVRQAQGLPLLLRSQPPCNTASVLRVA